MARTNLVWWSGVGQGGEGRGACGAEWFVVVLAQRSMVVCGTVLLFV